MSMGGGIPVGLIRFDLLRVRRSFQAVLSRWQDRAALGLMLALGALAAASAPGSGAPPGLDSRHMAIAGGLTAALLAAGHVRRMEALARSSVVAPLALMRAPRMAHLAGQSGALLALALVAAWALGMGAIPASAALGLLLLGWMGGTSLGLAAGAFSLRWRERPRRSAADAPALGSAPGAPRHPSLLAVTLRTQLPALAAWTGEGDGRPVALLCAAFLWGAAQSAVAALLAGEMTRGAGGAIVAGFALAALFSLARVPAGPCRFGLFAGVRTRDALVSSLALPAAAAAGACAVALPFVAREPGWLALELACGLAALLVAALRTLHYRVEDKAPADRMMQFQLAVLAAAAAALPPFAILLLLFRLGTLVRRNRAEAWTA